MTDYKGKPARRPANNGPATVQDEPELIAVSPFLGLPAAWSEHQREAFRMRYEARIIEAALTAPSRAGASHDAGTEAKEFEGAPVKLENQGSTGIHISPLKGDIY